ncbi:Apc15p protein-domain-containing protein [Xylariomycetidae sp. FL2044]|nr:Apc15p protein-domain-containing protein [Xylariomycetidae sp. FL2044]
MLSLLPDLTPRDSHAFWYASSRNPLPSNNYHDALANPHDLSAATLHGANHRRGAHLVERSPLARLRADEQNLDRRRANVRSFGSTWLKPPGVAKTLHQIREERREAEDNQELMRREQQMANEMAELEELAAAGEAARAAGGGGGAVLAVPGDDGMDDVQLDGARDLDEDIPEADTADFGLDGDDDDDEDEEEDEDDEEGEQDADDVARNQQEQLVAQRMRQTDDAFREDVARGRDSAGFYGVDEEVDDEDQAQMLEEDDLIQEDAGDMDMDADLDEDIPEAESGLYEHTDSDEDVSSSTDEDDDQDQAEMSFAAHASQQTSRSRFRASLARNDGTRNSLAMSDLLSRDGSSMLGSSPHVARQSFGNMRQGRN